MRITAGNLRDRVELLRPTQGLDDQGAPVVTFASAGFRHVQKMRFQGQEVESEAQRVPVAKAELLMRLDSLTETITTEWRIVFEGEQLRVGGLDRNRADGSLLVSGVTPQE